jgi:LPXTG-motif cell wall-anchored protein
MIYAIVPFIILAGIVYMIWKLKLSLALILVGALLIILSFFAYEQTILLITGIVLILIGLFLLFRKKMHIKKKFPGRDKGLDYLIKAAKQFNNWARRQPNPKFVGSWANFINYLKRGGVGGNEADICNRLQITKDDFVDIFNKYGKV